jgi:glutamyl-tRNA synthetase
MLVSALENLLPELGPSRGIATPISATLRAQLQHAMPGLKGRAKTLVELLDSASYLYAKRPLSMEDKAAALIDETAKARLARLIPQLSGIAEWTANSADLAIREFAEAEGIKLGQIAQPLRAVLTGKTTSPGVFDVMEVLGREECIARLQDQIAQ